LSLIPTQYLTEHSEKNSHKEISFSNALMCPAHLITDGEFIMETQHGDKTLLSFLEKSESLISEIGLGCALYQEKLTELKNRLVEGRFHLAVLGQFKRGKSTLLNALIGEPILPVAVIPLTAAPTFIQFGTEPMIQVSFGNGLNPESFAGQTTAERTAFLTRYVTEEGNPKNHHHMNPSAWVKGLTRSCRRRHLLTIEFNPVLHRCIPRPAV
jgi:hypothetical protein